MIDGSKLIGLVLATTVVGLSGASRAETPAVDMAAAPMRAAGVIPTYPRLVRFPDSKVMARVNTALAAQEKTDRDARNDCLAQLKAQHQKPGPDSYREAIEVSYLSPRFLSVNVVASYDCATAYPTDGAESPLTFDLKDGGAIDWTRLFKRGFLPPADADEHMPPSILTRLYRARYRPGARKDECRPVVTTDDPFASPGILRLDARRGLVVQPDFPHVTAACADELALSAADLKPYLADPAAFADLAATTQRKP